MKKVISIFCLFLIGIYALYSFYKKDEKVIETINEVKEERGVFISYIDYTPLFKNKNKDQIITEIDKIYENLKSLSLNTIYLQVRSYADAIYPSKYFLPSKNITSSEQLPLDILKYFVKKAKTNKIKIFAWINPYRISSNQNDQIDKDACFSSWQNTNKIEFSEEGIYFNPADEDVTTLILNGVKELVENYEIDGIIYDDYFYPNNTIDSENYSNYKSDGGNKTIEEYRIDIIDNLIKKTYDIIKKTNKNVLFGISPSGNTLNNLTHEYLDLESILKKENYLDFIIPQLYYGFYNETKPYIRVLNEFDNMIKTKNVNLKVALALYKSGSEDIYAKSGKNEWIENNNILMKQIVVSRGANNYQGFVIFRYAHLFNENKQNETMISEIKNLKIIF